MDGSDVLNVGIDKDHTSLIVTPSINAIQEIKVLTSNYEAMYPSTGNGTIVVTTKSGTDEYHGIFITSCVTKRSTPKATYRHLQERVVLAIVARRSSRPLLNAFGVDVRSAGRAWKIVEAAGR